MDKWFPTGKIHASAPVTSKQHLGQSGNVGAWVDVMMLTHGGQSEHWVGGNAQICELCFLTYNLRSSLSVKYLKQMSKSCINALRDKVHNFLFLVSVLWTISSCVCSVYTRYFIPCFLLTQWFPLTLTTWTLCQKPNQSTNSVVTTLNWTFNRKKPNSNLWFAESCNADIHSGHENFTAFLRKCFESDPKNQNQPLKSTQRWECNDGRYGGMMGNVGSTILELNPSGTKSQDLVRCCFSFDLYISVILSLKSPNFVQ